MELLSPAGSAEALRAAVQSGADAVYLGGTEFGARQSAKNFSAEEMKRWTDYCHLYGVEVHAAVNTLIKEKEIPRLAEYVKELNSAGVDALIVQDLGAADIIKNTVPDMTLHASTQMTVTNIEQVKKLEKMGFSRVVLARELNKKEIEYLCKNTSLEVEVFVHGAICMCYSGKCLMSSILGGRSGNRGRCAQPCRLPYDLTDGKETVKHGYLLSPKDMALIDDLGTLKQIGVKSLKIEGRLKRAEYVAAVTAVYRKYLDMAESGNAEKVSGEDLRILTDAFSRGGFTDGYFKDRLGKDMMSYTSPDGTGDTKFTDKAKNASEANTRKIPVKITGTLKHNSPLEVTISDGSGHTANVAGTLNSEKAQNVALDEKRLCEQLVKLGDTPFTCVDITLSLDEGITIPIREINAARRAAADALANERIKREKGRVTDYKIPEVSRKKPDNIEITVSVSNDEQREAAEKAGIKNIETFKPFEKFLNVYNSQTANILRKDGAVTLSPELNLREIKELLENTDAAAEVIAYGHLPLMIMKNCPMKALGKCQKRKNIYKLRDRKREEFPLMCAEECRAVLLNSKPLYMADKAEDLERLKINGIRLIFTVENYAICGKIIDEYKRAFGGEKIENTQRNFTRGHFYRGVL